MSARIHYRAGYKYQLAEPYVVRLSFAPARTITTYYLTYEADGTLRVTKGYAWDGPSGPTIDTKNFMRPSLVHDALYQLIREGHLDRNFRIIADDILYDLCREDGMSAIRAYWVWLGVRWGGGPACDPAHCKPELTAP